jgi:excisionase family DNA binding protein
MERKWSRNGQPARARGGRAMSASPSHTGPNVESPERDRGTAPVASSPPSPEASMPEPGPAERLAYSIDEAARLTGLSRDLLYDEMRRGNLTYVKVGRRRLITRHHLQQFLGNLSK